MYPTKIISGPVEVISSGSVIAFGNNPVEVTVDLEGMSFKIVFSFAEDENQDGPITTAGEVRSDFLELILTNFSNSLGSGNTEPIGIGSSLGRQLLISYRVYDLSNGETDKLLHYTLYRRLEAKRENE